MYIPLIFVLLKSVLHVYVKIFICSAADFYSLILKKKKGQLNFYYGQSM